LEFLGTREAIIWDHTVCKTAGVNSYTHQNGKVEGEAVGNLDRLLEWKTIHIGGGKLVTGQSSRGRSLLDLENFQLLLSVLGHQGGYKVVLT